MSTTPIDPAVVVSINLGNANFESDGQFAMNHLLLQLVDSTTWMYT